MGFMEGWGKQRTYEREVGCSGEQGRKRAKLERYGGRGGRETSRVLEKYSCVPPPTE